MNPCYFIPGSLREAALQLRRGLQGAAADFPKNDFVCIWSSIAYLYPGLHPDGFDDPDSGWPRVIKSFAIEAWRRAEAGELADEELYACDAQWAGLYDRMNEHTPQETARREEITKQM